MLWESERTEIHTSVSMIVWTWSPICECLSQMWRYNNRIIDIYSYINGLIQCWFSLSLLHQSLLLFYHDIFENGVQTKTKLLYQYYALRLTQLHPWWRHQMETFSALLALCAGNSPVTGEFSSQRPVTWGFDVFFDLRLNKLLRKQSWGWWFETPSRSLWRTDFEWCPRIREKYEQSLTHWGRDKMSAILLTIF